ncbi:hypothetical protein M9H77_34346 [Catharanthus roseus]|uniref:Uncharacterized protein n=1 Tax=Catharanthus roseus TaxID=4058 RepID=A0ACB9ZNF2_CATRO|nr:hypothetical protein M9H77_34346 [Catharanthus roseus]
MRMGPVFVCDKDEACTGDEGHQLKRKTDLMERLSKSRHLEELHKHQSGDKKGQYVDFHSEEFWARFHEVRQKGEEEALLAIVSGGLDRSRLYGVGSEAAHLRAESSRAIAGLPTCCLEAEKRIMRWVEASVSGFYAFFDEHMRRFVE